jgi:aminoglycoside phosphotransferase (APT) family kinase protein
MLRNTVPARGLTPDGIGFFPARNKSTASRRFADPANVADVAILLRRYLADRLNIGDLAFHKPPEEYPDGWETHTYSFQLQNTGRLPRRLRGRLIARIYLDRQGIARARHELEAMKHVRRLGFPVAEPLLLEEKCRYFGGPFFLRREAVGETLFKSLLRRPWKVWQLAGRMAALQARLHALPVAKFPAKPTSLLERSLDELAGDIHDAGWSGLTPGLRWLVNHRPEPPRAASILHLDFHPMNLIAQSDGNVVPIDWTEADVGDPHADIGTTLVLVECTAPKNRTLLDRLTVRAGRLWFVRWYLRTYGWRLPIDRETLTYYRAWAALRRLCRYGKWLDNRGICGVCKPCAVQQIRREDWQVLEAYFERWTGVRVRY